MGGFPQEARHWFAQLPMMAGTDGKVSGFVIGTSTTPQLLDLTTVTNPAGWPPAPDAAQLRNPAAGRFLYLKAEGTDAYVIFGPSAASLTSGNVPNPATTSAAASNVVSGVPTAGLCDIIPVAEGWIRFWLPRGTAVGTEGGDAGAGSPTRFLSVVTKTSTGFLRGYASSL